MCSYGLWCSSKQSIFTYILYITHTFQWVWRSGWWGEGHEKVCGKFTSNAWFGICCWTTEWCPGNLETVLLYSRKPDGNAHIYIYIELGGNSLRQPYREPANAISHAAQRSPSATAPRIRTQCRVYGTGSDIEWERKTELTVEMLIL